MIGLFDGEALTASDEIELGKQLRAVQHLLSDGRWWLLSDIAMEVGCTEQSAGARCRDLRKEKFGGWNLERRRCTGARVYEYRLNGKRTDAPETKLTRKQLEEEVARLRAELARAKQPAQMALIQEGA